jgi:hypothetical protein
MARLDTQINQIYYLPAEADSASIILTDEVLNNNTHLFIIADLVKIQKKTEISDLKKISEIIVNVFTENKKLSGESLFETSLAAINQELADLAHSGKKSWLGKFSSLIAVKNADNIYLANTGQMSAMLYRDSAFLEILNPEKRGLHPLKTFSNFTTGKLKASDIVLLTTSNLFNYIALGNLNNMMSDGVEEVTEKVSKILKDTSGDREGFASFFISLTKSQTLSSVAEKSAEPVVAAYKPAAPVSEPMPEIAEPSTEEPQRETEISEPIYAPLPSEASAPKSPRAPLLSRLPKISLPSLPKFSAKIPKLPFWNNLSSWAKFFLISFIIFLILFASNIIVFTVRKHHKQAVSQTQVLTDSLTADINDAESALIYRNQDQAVKLLTTIQSELADLKSIDPNQASQYETKVTDLANRINHITVVSNPNVVLTLKHPATNITSAGKGFVIADQTTGNITTYNTTSSDSAGKDLFLLNKIGEIKGLTNIPNTGSVVITSSEMYLIDTAQSQFSLLHVYPKTDFTGLRFLTPDRLYTMDRTANQVYRIIFSKQTQNDPTPLLKTNTDLTNAVDLGVDTDVYVLFPTGLNKYTKGELNSFKLIQPTDEITSANKLFVANNIYVLESSKKRLLIYNKQGGLVTQIFFPNAVDMKDLYVDEQSRNIYILDSNKLLSITF